jgi:hypothetical protein
MMEKITSYLIAGLIGFGLIVTAEALAFGIAIGIIPVATA